MLYTRLRCKTSFVTPPSFPARRALTRFSAARFDPEAFLRQTFLQAGPFRTTVFHAGFFLARALERPASQPPPPAPIIVQKIVPKRKRAGIPIPAQCLLLTLSSLGR